MSEGQAPKGIDTTKLVQVAIVVKNIEAKMKAWQELLGVEPSLDLITEDYEKARTLYNGEKTDARIRVVVFTLGDVELELMEPIGGPGVWSEHLEQHGEGLHHIGFLSDSLEADIDSFEARGMPVVQQAEYPVGRYAYFRSEPQLGAMVEVNHLKGIPWPSE